MHLAKYNFSSKTNFSFEVWHSAIKSVFHVSSFLPGRWRCSLQAFINDGMKQQKKFSHLQVPLLWRKPLLNFSLWNLECLERRPKLLATLLLQSAPSFYPFWTVTPFCVFSCAQDTYIKHFSHPEISRFLDDVTCFQPEFGKKLSWNDMIGSKISRNLYFS